MTKLKQKTVALRISCSDIARALGVSDTAVRKWMAGRTVPKKKNIMSIIEYVNKAVDEAPNNKLSYGDFYPTCESLDN